MVYRELPALFILAERAQLVKSTFSLRERRARAIRLMAAAVLAAPVWTYLLLGINRRLFRFSARREAAPGTFGPHGISAS
jgi:hypothetical protein